MSQPQPKTIRDIVQAMRKFPKGESILTVKLNPSRRQVSYRVKWLDRAAAIDGVRGGVWHAEQGVLSLTELEDGKTDSLSTHILSAILLLVMAHSERQTKKP